MDRNIKESIESISIDTRKNQCNLTHNDYGGNEMTEVSELRSHYR